MWRITHNQKRTFEALTHLTDMTYLDVGHLRMQS